MTTQQNNVVAMTEEQLDAVAGGFIVGQSCYLGSSITLTSI